ncbi:hypothetical protein ACHHYP_01728 [Achlya hypogyna]|uniref:Integrator complex subunit 7 n=1 Tax=Achlya hypogyna TaxID=1202772 RepID=A0A1V9ZT41_ACHHY|nr:hypothetical protein ACHHYP_01728 [Achlya hypogyna]
MASEPAWACVASSAFPLVYAFGKDMSLGGRQSRVLEKDHAKLLQALEQQLKLKGTTHANKAETLLFYSHAPSLSAQHVELVLLRLAEQFQAINQLGFRIAVLDMIARIESHFKNKEFADSAKIVGPIHHVLAHSDDVPTRIVALQIIAFFGTLAQNDTTLHHSVRVACASSSSDEADAALLAAKALLAHSPAFQRVIASMLLAESIDEAAFYPLAPLLPAAVVSLDEAMQAWTKCESLCHKAMAADAFADPTWLRPLVRAMSSLSVHLPLYGVDQHLCLVRRLLQSGTAPLQSIALTGLGDALAHRQCTHHARIAAALLEVLDSVEELGALLLPCASLLEVAARSTPVPLPRLRRLATASDPRVAECFAHVAYHAARRDEDGAVVALLHVLAARVRLPRAPPVTTVVTKVLALLEALFQELPASLTATAAPVLVALAADSTLPYSCELWVTLSHLARLFAVADVVLNPALEVAASPRAALAVVVTALRSGSDPSVLIYRALARHAADRWFAFQLARECVLHGAFGVARELFPRVVAGTSSARMHHWTAGVAAWVEAEALLVAGPPLVPSAAMDQLHEAQASVQLAASSDVGFEALGNFLLARIAFLTTLQAALQYGYESLIAGDHVFAATKWSELQRQLRRHARAFELVGSAAWATADLAALLAHVRVGDLVIMAIDKAIHGTSVAAPSPATHPAAAFCADWGAHMAACAVLSMSELVALLQAVVALPCAVPRALLRGDVTPLALDAHLASHNVKQISRSVLGVSIIVGMQVTLALSWPAPPPVSPLADAAQAWTLQFDVTLATDGTTLSFDAPVVVQSDGSMSALVPVFIDAPRLAGHSSYALSTMAWVKAGDSRYLLGTKVLDRTIVMC